MMNHPAKRVLAAVLVASPVLAGTVVFDPPSVTVAPGASAQFQVTVTGDMTFDAPVVLVGSENLQVTAFDFEPVFLDANAFAPAAPLAIGIYPSDLLVGGFLADSVEAGTPVVIGTVTVATAGLADGAYRVQVDSVRDLGTSQLAFGLFPFESLSGSATVNVVSLPAGDSDADGVTDGVDAFPFNPDESLDTDGDGIGNNTDDDDDGDHVDDAADVFPLDPSETSDSDGDGIGDNADNDGVTDADESSPPDGAGATDADPDGTGETEDAGDDVDPLPPVPNPCGMGMIGALVFLHLGLGAMRFRKLSALWHPTAKRSGESGVNPGRDPCSGA